MGTIQKYLEELNLINEEVQNILIDATNKNGINSIEEGLKAIERINELMLRHDNINSQLQIALKRDLTIENILKNSKL